MSEPKSVFYRSLNEPEGEQLLLISSTTAQHSGVLHKRSFGHQNTKWSKRFFVVKDGCLLYYPENEKKVFDRGTFNIHPRGVIPLGGCTISAKVGTYSQPHTVDISSNEFSCGSIVLAAETRKEQDKWVAVLTAASRITCKNVQLGDAMIRELETQGLQLTKEKQDYVEQLQSEVNALRDEIDRNEELEKMKDVLEKEKKLMEETIAKLKEEHTQTKQEYEETADTLRLLEDDKKVLEGTTDLLQDTLAELIQEREHMLDMMWRREEENQNLYVTTEELHNNLQDIEDEIKILLDEKNELEQRFFDNQVHYKMLEEEKQVFGEQANYLLSYLNDLMMQKDLTDAELQEEVAVRMAAERRLQMAEDSIKRLELALQLSEESRPVGTELLPDVKNLKEFFEHMAEESRLDAGRPLIMKNAILSRNEYVQKVRRSRVERAKQEKDKSIALIFQEEEGSGKLRRTKSMLLNTRTHNTLRTLKRSSSVRANRTLPRCKKEPTLTGVLE